MLLEFKIWLENKDKKKEAIAKMFDLSQDKLNFIAEADPTPQGKFMNWIAKNVAKFYVRFPEDVEKMKSALKEFERVKKLNDFPHKDINKIKKLSELSKLLEPFKNKMAKREKTRHLAVEGAKLLRSEGDLEAYELTTPEAAAKLCRNTEWCVKDPSWYQKYKKDGPLYLIMKNGKQHALMHYESGHYMDVHDNPISEEELKQFATFLEPITGVSYEETKRDRSSEIIEALEDASHEMTAFENPVYVSYDVISPDEYGDGGTETLVQFNVHLRLKFDDDLILKPFKLDYEFRSQLTSLLANNFNFYPTDIDSESDIHEEILLFDMNDDIDESYQTPNAAVEAYESKIEEVRENIDDNYDRIHGVVSEFLMDNDYIRKTRTYQNSLEETPHHYRNFEVDYDKGAISFETSFAIGSLEHLPREKWPQDINQINSVKNLFYNWKDYFERTWVAIQRQREKQKTLFEPFQWKAPPFSTKHINPKMRFQVDYSGKVQAYLTVEIPTGLGLHDEDKEENIYKFMDYIDNNFNQFYDYSIREFYRIINKL